MLDRNTGKPVPNDTPMMVVINQIWDSDTTYAQRRAFIAVTWKNYRGPLDVRFCQEVVGMTKLVWRR
jgi:hypothetical protein